MKDVAMPRQRSPDRDKAEKLYIESKGDIPLKDIAEQLNLPEGTIRGWKNKDSWEEKLKGTFQIKSVKVTERSKQKKEKPKIQKKIAEDDGLTEKQRLFCLYYIRNFNATQAYIKAYQCSYDVANAEGYKLLVKPCIKAELAHLKEMKRQSIMLTEDDITERYMRIAFADMTDFVEFNQEEVPVMGAFGPIEIENPDTGEKVPLTKMVNVIKFKDSTMVDGGLICQIKQGKDGASIKLEDRQKALDWLSNFFEMNPMNRHKRDYDRQKLQIEKERLELEKARAIGEKDADEALVNDWVKAVTDDEEHE